MKNQRLIIYLIFFSFLCAIFSASPAFSSHKKKEHREYIIKAGFIYNFTEFIQWPEGAFANDREEFVIGVVGDNPFGDILDRIAKTNDVKGRKLTIKYFPSAEKIEKCHILFVASSEKENLEKISSHLKGLPTLIIGDTPGFAERGAAFNFFIAKKKKLRFKINLTALNRSGLKTSAKLLSLGEIVE